MKDWPGLLLKVRRRLSPRYKGWEPYSSFIRKYMEGINHSITCLEVGGFTCTHAPQMVGR
jgi:Trk-type K+ transport system membrane component